MRLPNGFGGISKLSGNRRKPYAVRITLGWTDEAKQIVKYLGYYKTRAEALQALSEYRSNPYDLSDNGKTMMEIYEAWKNWLNTDKQKDVTANYKSALTYSEPLYNMKFADIRKRHVQGLIDNCPKGYSTKKNIKILFNQLFKFAIDMEVVKTNYATLCELPAREESRLHKPFTDDEIRALWANSDEPAASFALVYIYTGLRPQELLKITTDNVFIDKRYMLGGMKTAAGRNRVIPISDKIMPIIKSWYNPDNEYLCMCKDGKPVLTYDRLRSFYWQRSKLLAEHLPHDGRHTCATLLDNAGVNKRTVQLILGHSAKDLTERVYTHKTIGQLVEAINKI